MSITLLPSGEMSSKQSAKEYRQTTNTYAVNFTTGVVRGFTDRIEAMKQMVFKCLQTNRFGFDIYDDDYGFEAAGLIGKDYAYIECELKRRVSEALLVDQRIKAVKRFQMTKGDTSDAMHTSFLVQTIFGDIEEKMEVLLK